MQRVAAAAQQPLVAFRGRCRRLLAILFLTSIRDGLVRLIQPAPLSDDVRLAVLVNDSALPRGDRDRLTGLHDYIVIRLADLKRFRQTLSVVPSSELREALVR